MWKWEAEHAKAVIVMVHGASEHHGRYTWLIEQWRKEQFHVAMGDLPGQGTTSRKQRGHIHSFNDYIETIDEWVRNVTDYELPIFLFGHSMGGLAVIRALQEKTLPVTAVILSSPCLGIVEPPPKPLDILSKGLNVIMPSLRLRSHLEPGLGTRNEEIKERDKHDSLYVRKVSIRWYRELVQAIKLAHNKAANFPNIPLLIHQAGDDKIVDKHMVRQFFDTLPLDEKMYKEWEGLYHEVFNEPERDIVFHLTKHFAAMRLPQ